MALGLVPEIPDPVDVVSLTREQPGMVDAICRAMTGSEFFACYRASDGSVIALDRQGITISV